MSDTLVSISTWTPIVVRIRNGSDLAVEELYKSLRGLIRFFFSRQIGPERAEDAYHNLIINLVANRKGTRNLCGKSMSIAPTARKTVPFGCEVAGALPPSQKSRKRPRTIRPPPASWTFSTGPIVRRVALSSQINIAGRSSGLLNTTCFYDRARSPRLLNCMPPSKCEGCEW
jgi:hypothetical protein